LFWVQNKDITIPIIDWGDITKIETLRRHYK
jgi:hypothetical protein